MRSRTIISWVGRSLAGRVGFRLVLFACFIALVAGPGAFLQPPAAAQSDNTEEVGDVQTDTPADPPEQLEEVVVEAELERGTSLLEEPPPADPGGLTARGAQLGPLGDRELLDIPFSVTSFTDTFAKNQQPIGLRDVLKSDPAVTNESARGAFFDGFRLRGLRANYVYDGLPGVFDRGNALSTEEYARVEVFKGPSAIVGAGVNGQNFVGGLVNLVPKRATKDPITDVSLHYLSGNAYKFHADIGRRFGSEDRFGVRINTVTEEGELNVDGTSIDRESVNMALDYRGNGTRLTADLGWQARATAGVHPNFTLSAGVPVPDAPELDRTYGQPWQEFNAERLRGVFRVEHDLNPDWTVGASYSDVYLTEWGPSEATATVTNNAGDYSHTLNLNSNATREYEDWTIYAKGNVVTDGLFNSGKIEHNLALTGSGGEENNHVSDGRFIAVQSNLNDPVYVDERADSRIREPLLSTNENEFVTLVDEMSFQEGKYKFIAGGQWIEFSRRSFTFFTPRTLSDDFETDEWVPITALTYQPGDDRSYYLSYAESLDRGDQAPAGTANVGQTTDPTLTEQLELGMKRDFGSYRLTTALFRIVQANTFTDPATNVFGNFGEEVHRGLEVNLSGEWAEGIRTTSGVVVLDAEQTETAGDANDGNRPVATPDLRVSVTGEYDVAVGLENDLTLTGGVYHVGEQYVDAANTQEVPSWTRLDLGARYTFEDPGTGAPFTTRLKVENVTDEKYWDNAAFGLTPGTPLTVLMSATTRF